MKTTTENNKLIAEFMKLIYRYDGTYHHIQLFNNDGTPKRSGILIQSEWTLWNPHKDWNDLMPVVEKIESLGFDFAIYTGGVVSIINTKDYPYEEILEVNGSTKKEAVYNAVVAFIEWYNSQTK